MKRPERCTLDDAKHASKFVISEHLAHYRLILPWLRGKVLDAGSGEGFGVNMMRQAGLDAWGLDVSAEVVERTTARYGSYFRAGSITQIPYEDGTFDAVTCLEVIEHVTEADAAAALKEIHRVLRAGGLLVLSTPNVASSPGAGSNVFHLKEYTRRELTSMLESTGLGDIQFFGLLCTHDTIQKLSRSGVLKVWLKFKAAVGLNRPLWNLGHLMEKVLTGKTTKNILDEEWWSLAAEDETTPTMVLTARKREHGRTAS